MSWMYEYNGFRYTEEEILAIIGVLIDDVKNKNIILDLCCIIKRYDLCVKLLTCNNIDPINNNFNKLYDKRLEKWTSLFQGGNKIKKIKLDTGVI